VVPRHDVVDVVDSSGPHPNLGEICGPDTAVGVLRLILREVWRVDMVVDVSAWGGGYLSRSSHSW
jgi:hypothetical protein